MCKFSIFWKILIVDTLSKSVILRSVRRSPIISLTSNSFRIVGATRFSLAKVMATIKILKVKGDHSIVGQDYFS